MLNILASIISIALTPQVCLVPCSVQVKVKIEKAEASDKARVEISETTSSDIVVEEGKRTYVLPNSRGFYILYEPGEYEVTVYLLRRGQKATSATAKLIVKGIN